MTKEYCISKACFCNTAINWDSVEAAPIDEQPWQKHASIKSFAKVCYDEMGLYARLYALEENILARFTGVNDMICLDSCLEMFMCPQDGDLRYFNFEFNPNGALYLGFGQNRYNSVRQLVQDANTVFRISPFKNQNIWGIEFFVPVSFLRLYFPGFTLKSGNILSGNFYKCGEETIQPHYLTWNEIKNETPDFHLPQYFGKWILQ